MKVLQQSSASIAAKSRHQAASPAAPSAISISSTSASSQAAGSSQQGKQPSSQTKVDASAAAAPKASFDCGPTNHICVRMLKQLECTAKHYRLGLFIANHYVCRRESQLQANLPKQPM